jgi:hypothetical protein
MQSGEVAGPGAPQQRLLLVSEGVGEDAGAGVPAPDDLVHAGQVKVGAGAGERVAQVGLELRGL